MSIDSMESNEILMKKKEIKIAAPVLHLHSMCLYYIDMK